MPDHLHLLLFQSDAGSHVSDFMRELKKLTSRHVHPEEYNGKTLWNDHYDDVPVPGLNAVVTKLQYIHANPVRRGLVQTIDEYLWSSARDYLGISKGIILLTKPELIL
jgi:putative transposase